MHKAPVLHCQDTVKQTGMLKDNSKKHGQMNGATHNPLTKHMYAHFACMHAHATYWTQFPHCDSRSMQPDQAPADGTASLNQSYIRHFVACTQVYAGISCCAFTSCMHACATHALTLGMYSKSISSRRQRTQLSQGHGGCQHGFLAAFHIMNRCTL